MARITSFGQLVFTDLALSLFGLFFGRFFYLSLPFKLFFRFPLSFCFCFCLNSKGILRKTERETGKGVRRAREMREEQGEGEGARR